MPTHAKSRAGVGLEVVMGLGAELTRQLLPAVYAVAGAGESPNLTLYWLVQKSQAVTSGEVFGGYSK